MDKRPIVELVKIGYYEGTNEKWLSCDGNIVAFTDSRGELFIVDTGLPTPENQKLLRAFIKTKGKSLEEVKGVIETHGHEDHTGNKGLFPFSIHYRNEVIYWWDKNRKKSLFNAIKFPSLLQTNSLESVGSLIDDDRIKLLSAPSHTLDDIVVFVDGIYQGSLSNSNKKNIEGVICISGDVFYGDDKAEKYELDHEWVHLPQNLAPTRKKILDFSDVVIPGHALPFIVQK